MTADGNVTPPTGSRAATLLPIGTRVRCKIHPELLGRIEGYEWKEPGTLSPIPYRINWDSNSHACDLRGWFFLWGSPDNIEEAHDG